MRGPQTESFFTAKETISKVKRQPTKWKKYFQTLYLIRALWEAKAGGLPEVRSLRSASPTWQNPVSTKTTKSAKRGGTWMNLETIILSKLTQEQKAKHHMFSLIDMSPKDSGGGEGATYT
ncbi:putative uncharacterized protein C8orf44 [Plecturocebus cupreus]